jgi:pyruvate/2-oxoglutarate dehydrogenase complex dihydrolipoamide acyltransferase (E2) component
MTLINTIFAPQESVNDQFISLISLFVKSGEYIESDVLIAELETSKAAIEIRSEIRGYIKVFVKENSDIKVGSKMFEFYDTFFEEELSNDHKIGESISKINPVSEKQNTIFSKAALISIKENNLNIDEFSNLTFVTTKDFNAKKNEYKNVKLNINNEIISKEINASEKEFHPISKSKKKEFEYLYSVNSSSVISRLSISVIVNNKDSISLTQNFIKSTPLPTIIQEVSKLLLKYPFLNSFYIDGQRAIYTNINIGFAIDDGVNGLKVASILSTDSLTLSMIEEAISDLTLKYSNNQLNVLELTSATFTITDLFNTDIVSFHPLVNVNNGCILGISSLKHGEFIIDLSFDHRLTSGKEVSQFLGDLKYRLEARFNNFNPSSVQSFSNVKCVKCYRGTDEDIDGNIFFHNVINSKYSGYVCSNCLNGL